KKSVSEHHEIHGVGKTLIMLIQMFNSSGNWSRFFYYFWNVYGTPLTAFFIHLYQIICKPLLDRGLIK
ncbi:hypothetical protein, partial [Staphylococcus aureus]|uniref:hypothetical protein n=1 Tax=Staphylococcus aureus TaxID=1280 RepID=UPI001C8366E8